MTESSTRNELASSVPATRQFGDDVAKKSLLVVRRRLESVGLNGHWRAGHQVMYALL